MIKVYLSKSNTADADLVYEVRKELDAIQGIEVIEYIGGKYSKEPLIDSDFMVMVLPDDFQSKEIIGRGQFLQIKDFTQNHPIENILCVHEASSILTGYPIESVELVRTVGTWQEYAELELNLDKKYGLVYKISTIIKNNKKTMKTSTNSTLKNRLMSQFLPVLAEDLGISMDGNICVFKGDDAISINANGELINYPKEMAIKCGLYLISKPVKEVKEGDIVKINGSYGKVIGLGKTPGDVRTLSFTGTRSTKVTAKDGLLNTNNVQVVLNVFGDSINGMNPMLMMLIMDKEEENDSMSSMLPFLMMSQQQGGQQNMFGGMNPMMLMMLMGKKDIDPMMLMMMNGGLGNMTPSKINP